MRVTDQRDTTVLVYAAKTYSRLGDTGKAKKYSAMALSLNPRDKQVISLWQSIWQTTNEVRDPKGQ
jgi:hypothetical protein